MKIYLAGPISGRKYKRVLEFFMSKIERLRAAGHTVLNPMLGKDDLRNEPELRGYGYKGPTTTNHAIFERDQWMVQQADVVFADLSCTERVSIGTCFELAWASLLGKHTIAVVDSVHWHAFVLEAADVIFDGVDDAMEYLEAL